jgi:hypothetical protein
MLRLHRFIVPTAAIALCAAAPAVAQARDLRSPDAVAAGQPTAPPIQDYRTPDAVERVVPTTQLPVPVSRSGQSSTGAPPARVRIVEVPSTGFGWGDAGIGAAGMLAIVMLGVGIAMAWTHRRRRGRVVATTR